MARARRQTPDVPTWHTAIRLQSIVPQQNRFRAYSIVITQTLLEEWAVIRTWGRIDRRSRAMVMLCPTESEARKHANELVHLRLLHGYDVVETA
jgi:predicted DNA-binding WGR domain protein